MKKAIEILEQHIRSYRSMIELYEANPYNQAITEYSAKESANCIVELQAAVATLNAEITGQLSPNSNYAAAIKAAMDFSSDSNKEMLLCHFIEFCQDRLLESMHIA